MKPEIGVADKDRATVVDLLNALLADEAVLYTKTRNYHWNVRGMHFNDLHKFFDAQYGELNEIVDEVAERARSLGGVAIGSLAEFVMRARGSLECGEEIVGGDQAQSLGRVAVRSLSELLKRPRLNDRAGDMPDAPGMIRTLLEDHENVIRYLRSDLKTVQEKHGDAGTSDFLTGLMEQHEKMSWMLRSYLDK
jgi:starvation-inducible DNA-binding protein